MNVTDVATEFSCRPASPDRQDDIVSIYRQSFDKDPVFQWLFPDAETRPPLLEKFFTVMAGHTFAHGGSILQTKDYGAVSMYFPPDAVEQPKEIRDGLLDSLRDALGNESSRTVHLLTMLSASHPLDLAPHYYGTFVAARPQHQGGGLGTRLKKCLFALADEDRAGAYAEASSPRNLALYERLGQRRLGPVLTLPDGPPVFPIWRPPSTAAGRTHSDTLHGGS
ncbi:GNAT family N-acetyltransferase [Streptomyces sp. 150FB]|uniref:GNAT family N-acetyltransferase n=1 Tax=Streptomyces sp. 150FB TaxID=1576605 RepID=UPI0006965374|nr:GNAT family N-acetyltransferase [Streptomyces sp. 150FB]